MKFRRKEKTIGIIIITFGAGIISVILIPTMGWIVFSGIILIVGGIWLLKKC